MTPFFYEDDFLRQILGPDLSVESGTLQQPPLQDVADPEWNSFMSMPENESSDAHLQNDLAPNENTATPDFFTPSTGIGGMEGHYFQYPLQDSFDPTSASPMHSPSLYGSSPIVIPAPISSTSAAVPVFPVPTDNVTEASSRVNHVLATYPWQLPQEQHHDLLHTCIHSEGHSQEPASREEESILHGFLELIKRSPAEYRCLFDDCGRSIKRQDRALGHIRMHLGHRPYSCNGKCGNELCEESFSCRSYLRSHITREKNRCEDCGKAILRQNMKRHQKSCPKTLA